MKVSRHWNCKGWLDWWFIAQEIDFFFTPKNFPLIFLDFPRIFHKTRRQFSILFILKRRKIFTHFFIIFILFFTKIFFFYLYFYFSQFFTFNFWFAWVLKSLSRNKLTKWNKIDENSLKRTRIKLKNSLLCENLKKKFQHYSKTFVERIFKLLLLR